jgi:hypothetical protein
MPGAILWRDSLRFSKSFCLGAILKAIFLKLPSTPRHLGRHEAKETKTTWNNVQERHGGDNQHIGGAGCGGRIRVSEGDFFDGDGLSLPNCEPIMAHVTKMLRQFKVPVSKHGRGRMDWW